MDASTQSIKRVDFILDRLQIEESIVKNNLYEQGQGTNRLTDWPKLHTIAWQNQQTTAWQSRKQSRTVTQSRARLLGRPNKRLLSETEDNQERLRKRPKLQTNKVKNNQSSNKTNDRPRTIKRSKAKCGRTAIKQTTHLRAVGSRQTLPKDDWSNTRTSTSTARGLEPVEFQIRG